MVKTQVVHRPAWPFKVTRLLQVHYGELGHAVVRIKEALLKSVYSWIPLHKGEAEGWSRITVHNICSRYYTISYSLRLILFDPIKSILPYFNIVFSTRRILKICNITIDRTQWE